MQTGAVVKLNGTNGTVSSHATLASAVTRPMVTDRNGRLIAVTGSTLRILDTSGTEVCSVNVGATVTAGPVVSRDGTAYVGDQNGNLRAYTASCGARVGFSATPVGSSVRSLTIDRRDDLLAVGQPDVVRAVQGDSGATIFRLQHANAQQSWVNTDETLFVADSSQVRAYAEPAHIANMFGDTGVGCEELQDGGDTYWICRFPQTYAQAKSFCEMASMELAAIESAAENTFLSSALSAEAWVGGGDAIREGAWAWQDGAQFWNSDAETSVAGRFTSWSPGEPNSFLEEDCLELYPSGVWNDEICSLAQHFVCEYNPRVRSAAPADGCWLTEDGTSWYWHCFEKKTRADAEAACVDAGGHLATVQSLQENTFLNSIASETSWLGGNDIAVEGQWRWPSGTQFWNGGPFPFGGAVGGAFTRWGFSEPNNLANEDCLALSPDSYWADYACQSEETFICEIPK